jgi:hypothetical protein
MTGMSYKILTRDKNIDILNILHIDIIMKQLRAKGQKYRLSAFILRNIILCSGGK